MTVNRHPAWRLKWFLMCLFCIVHSMSRANETIIDDPNAIRMGFYYPAMLQIASRSDILVSMNFWIQELSHTFDIPVTPVQLFDDIDLMAKAFSNGGINLVIAPPLSIAIHFEREALADCLVASRQKGKQDDLIVVARGDNEGVTLKSLQRKHLLMPENDELAEVFINSLTFKMGHLSYQKFFSKITPGTKAKRMVLDLFFDKADAAIVNQATYELMLELNPQIAAKVKVIAHYPLKSKNYSFVHRDYPLRERVAKEYLNVGKTVRGQQMLMLYQQEKMELCDVKDLAPFDALYKEYLKLIHKK